MMSSANPYSQDSNQPPIPRPSGNNTGLIIGIVAAVVAIPVLLLCMGVLVGLLLPAVQASREAARRMQCSNNMKQIALAMHNYEAVWKSFPPAYTVDESGNRLHSWRTLILPYIEQNALYKQIDLSKPWDDPVNQPYSAMAIAIYQCPSTPIDSAMTTYVAVVDPSGVFTGEVGTTFAEISDGTRNTLLVAETDMANAVNWMSPEDSDLPTFTTTGVRKSHAGGSNCALCDGSVQFFSDSMDSQSRDALVSKDGGDTANTNNY